MEARDLAVSDADRARVGDQLHRAFGRGVLSLGEFTERMITTLAARTRGDLDAVVVDIPGIRIPGTRIAEYAGQSRSLFSVAPLQVRGTRSLSADEGAVIRARLSSVTRTGPWQVPATLIVENRLGTITLDFTRARMTSQVVDIVVDNYCGAVELVLPAEATADFTGVRTIAGSINTHVPATAQLGPLHLFVHGKNVCGRLRHS